jgi:hypothetical protein
VLGRPSSRKLYVVTWVAYTRSIVVDFLETKFLDDRNIGIACVYFDYSHDFDPVDIFRTILKHIIQRKGVVSQELYALYQKHKMKDSTPLSIEESIKILEHEVDGLTDFLCVIDGLDESSESTRETVLQELQKLQPKLRLMITGRSFVEDVPFLFPDCQTLKILGQNNEIKTFILHQIQKDRFLRSKTLHDMSLKELIIGTVLKKANGM